MDSISTAVFPALTGDLAFRARVLEIRHRRLIQRQISFAVYCRRQAVAARQDAERSGFPELRAAMLRIAESYERMAATTDQFVRRFTPAAGRPDRQFPDLSTAEAA